MKKSTVIALSSMLCALGVVFMLLGGVIPLATFCCPALAGITLIPVLMECGKKQALLTYAATAVLALLFCPDKEAALLYVFLGYYPAIKPGLDRIRHAPLRIFCKLIIFNAAAGATLATAVFLLNMQAILTEYMEMGTLLLIAFVLIANITMLLYDCLYLRLMILYKRKIRNKLFHNNGGFRRA